MQAKTERVKYLFSASGYSNGAACVAAELKGAPDLTVMGNQAFLGFDLYDDSPENARRVAKYLEENIRWTTVTALEDHPQFYKMTTRSIDADESTRN